MSECPPTSLSIPGGQLGPLAPSPSRPQSAGTRCGPPGAHPLLALLADPELRGEDLEGLDAETERFLSTSSTGRRVSFNEAALFEQSRKAQDKGRR